MSIIKIIGLSSLLLGSCLLLPAQNNYLVERFTTDNGLPSNGIKGLQWDQETGFLWIATEAGVTRYNGADFVTFSRLNTPELFSERMFVLLNDRAGKIYTANETGNVFFALQNKLQYMGQAKVDTRPSTFKLTGLIASGRLFRQSSGQLPGGFGFNFSSDLLIPLSQDRLLLTSNDSLYDYRLGRRDPYLLTTVARGAKGFYLGGQLFVYDGRRGFYRLDPDTLQQVPVPVKGTDFGEDDRGAREE